MVHYAFRPIPQITRPLGYLGGKDRGAVGCEEPAQKQSAKRSQDKMATGTVKWFNDQKGFGFISPDGGGDDLFIHHTNIQADGFRSLKEGQKVDYEAGQGRKGPEAT